MKPRALWLLAIVVIVLMTSTAGAVTITSLTPDPLYLQPYGDDLLLARLSETVSEDTQISVSLNGPTIISAPSNVSVLTGYDTTNIPVTSLGPLGEVLVTAALGDSSASARVIVADAVPIPGAVWLLGSGLIGIVGIKRKFKKK